MPLNDAEGPNEPFTVADSNLLLRFLREHPMEKLRVVDVRQALASGSPEKGQLTIGINDTLLARFGVNGFAVINYPGRFKLDEPSLETYRRIVREEALAAARTEPDDAPTIDLARYRGYEPEPDRAEALEELTGKLTNAFKKNVTFAPDERAFSFSRHGDIVGEYLHLAEDAGLPMMDFKVDSKEVRGVWGQAVAALLQKTLTAAGKGNTIAILEKTDSCHVGPWVIIFDLHAPRITIGNKGFAEEHPARFLT